MSLKPPWFACPSVSPGTAFLHVILVSDLGLHQISVPSTTLAQNPKADCCRIVVVVAEDVDVVAKRVGRRLVEQCWLFAVEMSPHAPLLFRWTTPLVSPSSFRCHSFLHNLSKVFFFSLIPQISRKTEPSFRIRESVALAHRVPIAWLEGLKVSCSLRWIQTLYFSLAPETLAMDDKDGTSHN